MSMSRRGGAELQEERWKLGVGEFLAAVNGEDPVGALRVLRKFARIVRRERELALGGSGGAVGGGDDEEAEAEAEEDDTSASGSEDDEEEDGSESDDDDDDDIADLLASTTSNSSQKRRRTIDSSSKSDRDKWKADTRNYAVPFVGTSVARGSTGTPIRRNVWPCGLLESYLETSPNAVELLGGLQTTQSAPSAEGDATGRNSGRDNNSNRGSGDHRGGYVHRSFTTINTNPLVPPHGALHRPWLKSGNARPSALLHEAYLRAVEEVATAAVPVGALRREYGEPGGEEAMEGTDGSGGSKEEDAGPSSASTRGHGAIAAILARDHLRPLLRLLDEQCSRAAASNTSSYEKGKGKGGGGGGQQRHRVGPLAPAILRVLTAVAATGTGAAREVARGLDSELAEGALRAALAASSGGGGGGGGVVALGDGSRKRKRGGTAGGTSRVDGDARTEALRLCSVLLQSSDPTVLSFVCTGGSRERKAHAGVVHTALRVGLAGGLFDTRRMRNNSNRPPAEALEESRHHENYLRNVRRFLASIRDHVLSAGGGTAAASSEAEGPSRKRRSLDGRVLLELFNGDVLDQLMRISSFAPPLVDVESFRAVLAAIDDEEDATEVPLRFLKHAARECRRIIFLLLGDKDRSPFLAHIHDEALAAKEIGGRASPQEHIVNRALLWLVSNEYSLPTRAFILHCLHTTPHLVFLFFRSLPMPEAKPTYECLSALAFVSNVVTDGPSVADCMPNANAAGLRSDQAMPFIVPTSTSKAFLTKAIQSQSALLVAEVLRLISDVLKRAGKGGRQGKVADALQKRLPDLQILLSLRSRFDPFVSAENDFDDESESTDEEGEDTAALSKEEVVALRLCEVLQLYGQILPAKAIGSAKFDWAKLFPDDLASFLSVSSSVQLAFLETFDATALQRGAGVSIANSPKSIRALLTIVLSSTSNSVYNLARKLAISLILRTASTDTTESEGESRRCLEYEASLWVDGASLETLEDIINHVTTSSQHAVQHVLSVSRAWSAQFPSTTAPRFCFSGVLSGAIAGIYLEPSGISSAFNTLVCGIATKSLLYHRSPQALASFIKYCLDVAANAGESESDDNSRLNYRLAKYASSVLNEEESHVLEALDDLLTDIFGDNLHSKLCHVETDSIKLLLELVGAVSNLSTAFVRQCLNQLSLIRNHSNQKFRERLHLVIQGILAQASGSDQNILLRDVFEHPYMLDGCDSIDEVASLVSSLRAAALSAEADTAFFDKFAKLWVQKFADALLTNQVCNSLAALMSSLASIIGSSFSVQVVALILMNSDSLANSELLRSLLLTTLTSVRNVHSFDISFPASEMVKLWIELSSSNNSTKKERIDIPLQLMLEEVMCNVFIRSEGNGIVADKLASGLLQHIEEVFPCYVASVVLLKERSDLQGQNLLAAMMKYDCVRFALPISVWLAPEKQPLLKVQLGQQWFAAISPVLLTYTKQMARVTDLPDCPPLRELAWQGVEAVLSESPKHIEEGNVALVKDWLPVMLSLVANGDVVRAEDALKSTVLFFRTLASRPRLKLAIQDEVTILQAAISLCTDANCNGFVLSNELGSYVFLRLLILLPKALRKGRRRESQIGTSKDHDPVLVLEMLIRLLREGSHLAESIILGDEATLRTGFISCLKHGIKPNETGGGTSVSSLCLRFAHTLVATASTEYPEVVEQVEMLQPAQVHRMVTSHSSFSATLQQGSAAHDDQTSTQRELINLLISCASLSYKGLEDTEDAWKAALQAYSAGVTQKDKALRRLMHLYASSWDEKGAHFMDSLQWGDVLVTSDTYNGGQGSNLDGGDHAQQYEWFVQGLDIRRVRSTLSCFPVWDRIIPVPDASMEPWTSNPKEDNADKDDASTGALDESLGDDGSDEERSGADEDEDEDKEMAENDNELPPRPRRKEDQSDKWNGHGTDDRYSPPFILTLTLATLEAFNPPSTSSTTKTEHPDHNFNNENDDAMFTEEDPNKPQRETFVKIARRLSEKGCISLSLASLSSKCPDLRCIAIATLGLFLKAVHMEEAHSLKTWRERPQLAMVLDSVQRGILVRRAISIARRQEEGDNDKPLLIPMFPAVSAVFLGWSALIVSRPSDDMFASANRCFLRLDDYHGAFKDCFSLPAFISLFCGSFADENSQARRERLWALQLLKDGVRDSYCYKVAARRHAPALIMTSFESLIGCGGLHENDAEPHLLLEAIECLLLNGGHAARHHLLSNLGLCSWLRGLLIGRPSHLPFPSTKIFLLFNRLVDNAFKCAIEEEGEKPNSLGDVRTEAMAIAGPLVRAYAQVHNHVTESTTGEVLYALLCTLETLSICSSLGMDSTASRRFDSMRNDGIPISAACRLLDETATLSEDRKAKATKAISALPISISPGDEGMGKKLCLVLLQNARQATVTGSASVLGSALNCVLHVLGAFGTALHGDEDLIEVIVSCRMKAQWCGGGSSALSKSLKVLCRDNA